MNSFGLSNGQDEDDLDLQRALAESLREYNNTNNIGKTVINSLDGNKKQKKNDDFECINKSATFNDLISYSKSVQNELVNILTLNNNKKKNDIDSLIQIFMGEKNDINYKLHEELENTYDCLKDKELKPLPTEKINDLVDVIFGTNGNILVQGEDIKRWINNTIEFIFDSVPKTIDEKNNDNVDFQRCNKSSIFTFKENFNNMNYCLVQQGGGPCGILASLNGFIISRLIYNPLILEKVKENQNENLVEYLNSVSKENCWEALIQSICIIIFQSCSESKYRIIQYKQNQVMELSQQDEHYSSINKLLVDQKKDIYYYVEYENIMDVYQFYYKRLKYGIFSNKSSLFSILLSVVSSRAPDQIRFDMDDFMTPLVGMFGHCSQELVNLFITGKAVSNVFDGIKILNDNGGGNTESLSLKGINKKSLLGYLTEHEALQYCKVGLNYKYPLYPIWIIVNKNHYKCSFSFNFTECILTASQEFTQVIQKAFEKFDTDNSGFIFDNQLENFLNEINLKDYIFEVQKLSENGIILWSDLKRSILNLMGIENEQDNRLRGNRIEDFSSNQYKLWTSVYIFDGQKHIGKKLIISTIFSMDNYSSVKNLYHELSGNKEKFIEFSSNDINKKKSIEELDLISILKTRWGEDTIIETQILNI